MASTDGTFTVGHDASVCRASAENLGDRRALLDAAVEALSV